tara:strand:+ start:483 stop:743 length:261 start_codon:yes stop_codon:yes gene_type:complete
MSTKCSLQSFESRVDSSLKLLRDSLKSNGLNLNIIARSWDGCVSIEITDHYSESILSFQCGDEIKQEDIDKIINIHTLTIDEINAL